MPQILYTVRTTCPSVQVRGRYLAWLSPNHIAQVMAAGAGSARIVLPDRANDTALGSPEPVERAAVVEVQYVFPSRKAFDTYVRDHAQTLRADGLKHFPPESGLTSERQVAEIAAEM